MAGTENLSADGATTAFAVNAPENSREGRLIEYGATGAFGAGTLALQLSWDNSTWVDSGETLTAAGWATYETHAPYARFNLTSATVPNIDVTWG